MGWVWGGIFGVQTWGAADLGREGAYAMGMGYSSTFQTISHHAGQMAEDNLRLNGLKTAHRSCLAMQGEYSS